MRVFNINTLQSFTGIKTHTLRIWEKRYGILRPQRTESNYRYFTIEELRKLLLISLLVKNGHKISVVSKYSVEELVQKVDNISDPAVKQEAMINEMIYLMFSREIEGFEDLLKEQLMLQDTDGLIEQVIMPFIERMNLFSYVDTTAEMHLIVTAIRKKLILGIESTTSMSQGNTALLFLPEHEHYDLMLLYATYMLKKRGVRTIYLGTNISIKTLLSLIEQMQPDAVYTHFPNGTKLGIDSYASVLHTAMDKVPVYSVSTGEANDIYENPVDNVRSIHYKDIGVL